MKDVKDYIRECPDCQYRRGSEDLSGAGRSRRTRKSRIAAKTNEEEDEMEDEEAEEDVEEDPELEDEEEEEGVEGLLLGDGSGQTRSRSAKSSGKHELVFVRLWERSVLALLQLCLPRPHLCVCVCAGGQ